MPEVQQISPRDSMKRKRCLQEAADAAVTRDNVAQVMRSTGYTTLLTMAIRRIKNLLFLRGKNQRRQMNHIKQNYALIRRNYSRKKLHNVMIP